MNNVQRWEIFGIFFIIVFGTTLHFWFEWTDYWRPVALIAAVNWTLACAGSAWRRWARCTMATKPVAEPGPAPTWRHALASFAISIFWP